jgi:hypothetical protein
MEDSFEKSGRMESRALRESIVMDRRPVRELEKFAVKFFAENPDGVELGPGVPVFHRWIQTHSVPGILIDVADYRHVPEGPGVVLVGHEADYSLDRSEGPLGLLYVRKRPQGGALSERLQTAFWSALQACERLEAEPEFRGRLRFRRDDPLLVLNDRLLAPNTPATYEAVKPELEAALGQVYPGRAIGLRREEGDPRRRLAVAIRVSGAPGDRGAGPGT